MKKFVVASDSFKGCLTSTEVADAVEEGILSVSPTSRVVKVNVADGGEGTMNVIVDAMKGCVQTVTVHDPLGRIINADYGLVNDNGTPTAVVEMAAASGLPLLREDERDPLHASTYGTGELIMDAISKGCRKFLICIGGSATNDAGIGMLHAMGYRFMDGYGKELDCCGITLGSICHIDDSDVSLSVKESEFVVACDVDTLFCGPHGAAYNFASQKGASPDVVRLLDEGMCSFAKVIKRQYNVDIIPVKGAGAAGGLGGAFKVFLNARLVRGIEMVLDVIGFDGLLKDADLVITGEGKIDRQTPQGKTAAGVLRRAMRQGIPVIAIGGKVELCDELESMGFSGIYSVNEPSTPLEQAMQKDVAKERICKTMREIIGGLCK